MKEKNKEPTLDQQVFFGPAAETFQDWKLTTGSNDPEAFVCPWKSGYFEKKPIDVQSYVNEPKKKGGAKKN